MLEEKDWRTIKVGAIIVASKKMKRFEPILEQLLFSTKNSSTRFSLCFAFAAIKSERGAEILSSYLKKTLLRFEDNYEQSFAMATLGYIDTDRYLKLTPLWEEFARDKPYRDLTQAINRFEAGMNTIKKLQNIIPVPKGK